MSTRKKQWKRNSDIDYHSGKRTYCPVCKECFKSDDLYKKHYKEKHVVKK